MDAPAPVPTTAAPARWVDRGALEDRAGELIRALAGPDAVIRPDQFAAIDALVSHHQRVLLVQATGSSAVYWIATVLLQASAAPVPRSWCRRCWP